MTLMDPQPGFQSHDIFEVEYVEYLKKMRLRDKITIEH